MDCFEELAIVLNSTGMELIKKLFLWSELMKCSSSTNETEFQPYRNYLSVLYQEKMMEDSK